jgi:hypothetical protein
MYQKPFVTFVKQLPRQSGLTAKIAYRAILRRSQTAEVAKSK